MSFQWAGVFGVVTKISAFRPQGLQFYPQHCQDLNWFVRLSFPPKLTQLSILPGYVNEYQRLLGANLGWISVPSRAKSKTNPLNTTETEEKRGSMGRLARKGFSFVFYIFFIDLLCKKFTEYFIKNVCKPAYIIYVTLETHFLCRVYRYCSQTSR